MNIVETFQDPALFGRHFPGGTWWTWLAFLKAWAGLGAEMTEAEAELFRQCTGRATLPTAPFEEATVIVSRRAGKSRIMAALAVHHACIVDHSASISTGERPVVAIISSDRRSSRVIFEYVRGLIADTPLLADLIEEETKDSLTLKSGVLIEVATASWRTSRGRSYAAVIIDELAFLRDDMHSANPALEIQRAVLPGLATLGGVLLKCSSPYARRGLLYDDWRRAWGNDGADLLCWMASSRTMNPTLSERRVARARSDDPDAAVAEWDGGWRSDVTELLPRAVVEAAVVPGRFELGRISSIRYAGFTDVAGGSGTDSFTAAVCHSEPDGRIVVDAIRERVPPFSPEQATAEMCEFFLSYGVRKVHSDRYGGDWPAELFRKHGVECITNALPKSDIYRNCVPLLNSGRIELLDHPKLTAQLCSLERRVARGGRDSIDHPPNGHDDCANAVLGAVWLAAGAGKASVVDRWRAMGGEARGIRPGNIFGFPG